MLYSCRCGYHDDEAFVYFLFYPDYFHHGAWSSGDNFHCVGLLFGGCGLSIADVYQNMFCVQSFVLMGGHLVLSAVIYLDVHVGVDVDIPDQCVDVDVFDQCVDFDAFDQCVHVDVSDQCVDFDVFDQCVDFDVSDQCVDIDFFDQCVDFDVHDQCVDFDVRDHSVDVCD